MPCFDKNIIDFDYFFLRLAINIAKQIFQHMKDTPVGAVLVDANGIILAVTHNLTSSYNDPTAHAEILCIRIAAIIKNSTKLTGCRIYTSLEPCIMCFGGMLLAHIQECVWQDDNKSLGAISIAHLHTRPLACFHTKHRKISPLISEVPMISSFFSILRKK